MTMHHFPEIVAGEGLCPWDEYPAEYRLDANGNRFCMNCGQDHEVAR